MDKKEFRAFLKKMTALITQGNELRAYLGLAPVKTEILRAGMAIAALDKEHPLRDRRIAELDEALKFLHLARSLATRASSSRSPVDWKQSRGHFRTAQGIARALRLALESVDTATLPIPPCQAGTIGDGIETANGIPLVPAIMPVVFLAGTDHEMGQQYAMQITALYGPWLLGRKAGRHLSPEEMEILAHWEEQLARHAPEIIGFAEGMAAGCRELGIPMEYHDALEIWTGVLPPESDYFGAGGVRMSTVPPLACSGVAAWGSATADGRLVTGSAGDFDPTFSATIVAWPNTGNAFVFTPFGATGDVPALGSVNMFGHPGMNSRGLAYVHHGGTPKMIEPKANWGYGLRRAPAVMHVLRFTDTAAQARDLELGFPVGDVGIDSGTCGGFWADDCYGCILESRHDPVLVREAGLLGEKDFLYSANSALHPEAGKHGWLALEREQWKWEAPGGWRPTRFAFFHKLGLVYSGSARRCAAFFRRLDRTKGNITLQTMMDCYREGGTIPAGDWREISRHYMKTGEWGELSPGNASNGILAFMKPSEGLYSVCIGPLTRGIPPTSPLFASTNPVRGETNCTWDLHLHDSPEKTADLVAATARRLVETSEKALQNYRFSQDSLSLARAKELHNKANEELAEAYRRIRAAVELTGNDRLGMIAGASCRFLRAQVRARQALREHGDKE